MRRAERARASRGDKWQEASVIKTTIIKKTRVGVNHNNMEIIINIAKQRPSQVHINLLVKR